MPSPLLCCLGGHQGLKSMHPTKFLGCNSWTLPFPIPAGAPGPAGLQSARSRAGPASQDSGFCPLDFQRTLGCLGNPRRLGDFSAEGWSGKGLDPKGEAFLRPPGWGALRLCQHRAEYMVPCSRQSPFPYLCSAPLRCGQWMPILGDPGVHEMGIPSRNGDPQQHIWKALPHPCQEPTPAANGPPPRPAPPGFVPALPGSRRVPSHIGDPREHNRDRPPTHSERNLDLCSPGLPHPGCAPGAFPAAVAISESTTGKPSPTPARSRHPPCAARVRPAPAALQGRCPPSPAALGEPRPHARFQERLSDLAAAARSNMRTIHTPHRDNPSCL